MQSVPVQQPTDGTAELDGSGGGTFWADMEAELAAATTVAKLRTAVVKLARRQYLAEQVLRKVVAALRAQAGR